MYVRSTVMPVCNKSMLRVLRALARVRPWNIHPPLHFYLSLLLPWPSGAFFTRGRTQRRRDGGGRGGGGGEGTQQRGQSILRAVFLPDKLSTLCPSSPSTSTYVPLLGGAVWCGMSGCTIVTHGHEGGITTSKAMLWITPEASWWLLCKFLNPPLKHFF